METQPGQELTIALSNRLDHCRIHAVPFGGLLAGGGIRIETTRAVGISVLFSDSAAGFSADPEGSMSRLLAALGRTSAPCVPEFGGWHFNFAGGGSLSAWPDALLFRDSMGNETETFFSRHWKEAPAAVLSRIIEAFARQFPSNIDSIRGALNGAAMAA
jgi:class 3 adenylate cyclase